LEGAAVHRQVFNESPIHNRREAAGFRRHSSSLRHDGCRIRTVVDLQPDGQTDIVSDVQHYISHFRRSEPFGLRSQLVSTWADKRERERALAVSRCSTLGNGVGVNQREAGIGYGGVGFVNDDAA
jgi:hypothetical protein